MSDVLKLEDFDRFIIEVSQMPPTLTFHQYGEIARAMQVSSALLKAPPKIAAQTALLAMANDNPDKLLELLKQILDNA